MPRYRQTLAQHDGVFAWALEQAGAQLAQGPALLKERHTGRERQMVRGEARNVVRAGAERLVPWRTRDAVKGGVDARRVEQRRSLYVPPRCGDDGIAIGQLLLQGRFEA